MAQPDQSDRVREAAEAIGMPVALVQNALHHPDLVSPAARQRVLSALQQTGHLTDLQPVPRPS